MARGFATFLKFQGAAEEAAHFYRAVFRNADLESVER